MTETKPTVSIPKPTLRTDPRSYLQNWFWSLFCPWHHHSVQITGGHDRYVYCYHCETILDKLPDEMAQS